nr:HD domain-containing protein [Succinivibrionaceae bacterium]
MFDLSGKTTLLVIDDDRFIHKMLGVWLRDSISSGRVELLGAGGGEEGLQVLAGRKVDAVLLDYAMPGIDGMETLRRLRAMPGLANLPVLVMSAVVNQELEGESFSNGASDFIQKPFSKQGFIQRVGRHVRYARLQGNLEVEVARQSEEIIEKSQQNVRLFNEMTRALAQTIDAKDRYTHGHSSRVAALSRLIARLSGEVSEGDRQKIYFAGLLHDIGKISIPDEIINKPSRLSDEEYALIKGHASAGHEILKNITSMPELSIGAHYHHELYNGKGYPEGLKGKEIPMVARIIGVADAYDAMTSRRSYRGCMPQAVV